MPLSLSSICFGRFACCTAAQGCWRAQRRAQGETVVVEASIHREGSWHVSFYGVAKPNALADVVRLLPYYFTVVARPWPCVVTWLGLRLTNLFFLSAS